MIKESAFNKSTVEMMELLYIMADKVANPPYFVENGKIYLDLGESTDER